LVIEEHVHIFDTVLKHPTAALDLIGKTNAATDCALLATRCTVVYRIASVHEELRDDRQLEHRLERTGRQDAQGGRQVKKNEHTTI
jgi:hypothetical protein